MAELVATQIPLLCPNCGGQRRFAPEQTALVCSSCGEPEALARPEDHDAAREFAYTQDTPETEPADVPDIRTHHCNTCGGEVIFTGAALSDNCPYCDGAVVLGGRDPSYRTMALIPFRETEDTAWRQARNWVANRHAAPNDLGTAVDQGRMAGLYAPFWTFDSREAVQYWARITTGSGKNRRTRSIKGSMSIQFDDLLVPASPHVTPLIRDGILHRFDPRDLLPYEEAYLAGFAAERHHQSVAEGLKANEDDKDLLIRNRIRQHINRSGVKNIGYRTDTSGIHYRRILLPVWILHYEYGGKPYKIVVSGLTGRCFGERPFSTVKLLAYSAAITAATLLFGMAWGAAGLL